jgi:hypothetical protein
VERIVSFYGAADYAVMVGNCEKLALFAMSRPGQYRLELKADAYYPACKLSRVSP